MNQRLLGLTLGAICFGPHASVRADSIALEPVRDNTLYQDASGSLSNGAGEYMYVGATRSFGVRRGLLAFDLSAIPTGSVITGVSLTMHVSRANFANQSVGLHRVTTEWGEGTSNAGDPGGGGAAASTGDATWTQSMFNIASWVTPGGDFDGESANTLVSGIGTYQWTSTPRLIGDVQSWLNNPSQNFGWLLLGDEGTSQTAKRFGTRESADLSLRPTLEVTYVPAPATGAAIVCGLLGFRSRRRNAR
jgi:hypothetical protein